MKKALFCVSLCLCLLLAACEAEHAPLVMKADYPYYSSAQEAVVAAKRAEVHTFHQPNAGDATGMHGYTTTTNTTYYVCFQFETGDRLELRVSGREYGMIAEGDRGKLTFQGSRYLDFERKEI